MAEGQDGSGRMMSSDELREHLSAYLDGQLSGDLVEQMEQTLETDEDLRAELESLRELVDGLNGFPDVVAPEGFAAGVMAQVEDLAIPSARDLGDLEEVDSSEFDQDLEPLSVPLWLKGSIAASLAATLVLGYLVVRAPMMTSHSELAGVAAEADSMASWGAPLATGLDDSSALDASASLDSQELEAADMELREEGFGASAPPPRAEAPRLEKVSRQQVSKKNKKLGAGGAGDTSPKKQRRRPKSGLKEVAGDLALSGGVYEAEHEEDSQRIAEPSAEAEPSGADGVVALDVGEVLADERIELDTELLAQDYQSSGSAGRAFRRESAAGGAGNNDEKPEGSGLRVGAEPPFGNFRGGLARRGSGRSGGRVAGSRSAPSSSLGTASSKQDSDAGPAEPKLAEQVAVVSEEKGEVPADAPSIAAKVVIGTLVVASPGVISTLVGEIRARGWALQNLTPGAEPGKALPATGTQILQIMVPMGFEEDLTRLLGNYGALNTDRALSAAHDGNARLRLTVRWGS